MRETIDLLREVSVRCRNGRPLEGELAHWLGESLQQFLDHRCRSVDDALGLHFPRGGVPWWRELAMRERDRALRVLAERFCGGMPVAARARRVRALSLRYAASTWRHDRAHDAMPSHYAGTPHELLWCAFRSGAAMPLGERQLRTILGP